MELNHVGTRTLKTTRLVLRPFYLSDAQAMYDNWASDSDVTKFIDVGASTLRWRSLNRFWKAGCLCTRSRTTTIGRLRWIVYRSALLGFLSSTKEPVLGILAIV